MLPTCLERQPATCFTLVDFQWSTWRYTPWDRTPHNQCCNNLKIIYWKWNDSNNIPGFMTLQQKMSTASWKSLRADSWDETSKPSTDLVHHFIRSLGKKQCTSEPCLKHNPYTYCLHYSLFLIPCGRQPSASTHNLNILNKSCTFQFLLWSWIVISNWEKEENFHNSTCNCLQRWKLKWKVIT